VTFNLISLKEANIPVFLYIVPFCLQSVLIRQQIVVVHFDLKRSAQLRSSLMSRLEASCDYWGSAYYLDLWS
jgi:hypothetical protein